MNDSEKLESLLKHLKGDYEFHHSMANSNGLPDIARIVHKSTSVVLAQAIETVDSEFVRKDYRYEP